MILWFSICPAIFAYPIGSTFASVISLQLRRPPLRATPCRFGMRSLSQFPNFLAPIHSKLPLVSSPSRFLENSQRFLNVFVAFLNRAGFELVGISRSQN